MLVLLLFAALSGANTVYLTVLYCPTYFETRGAVVALDTVTSKFSVVGQPFRWPIGDSGECSIMASPTVFFDRATGKLYLDFFSAFGKAVIVDVHKGQVAGTVTPKDPFFVQFVNFFVDKTKGLFGKTFLRGLHPTVTQNGLCNDGCFQMETIYLDGTNQTSPNLVLFKALMDDVDFWHDSSNVLYVQMSYDLRNATARCQTPHNNPSDLCLVAIDEHSGAVLSSTYTPWAAYKYDAGSSSSSAVTALVQDGFPECFQPGTETGFAFATVNLHTANATLISCMNSTIVMDEWIASFSPDHTELCTASGDAESGRGQVLCASVKTGHKTLEFDSNAIGRALGGVNSLYAVLSINY